MQSGSTGAPNSASWAAIALRRAGSPSVLEYWRARVPSVSKTQSVAFSMALTGKLFGEGRPPAKEITSGWLANLRSLRIMER